MAVALTTAAREQTRARYPDESGYVERDGVKIHYLAASISRSCKAA